MFFKLNLHVEKRNQPSALEVPFFDIKVSGNVRLVVLGDLVFELSYFTKDVL